MNTILVATDFSNAAKNAAIYAAHLAKKADAKLILFNSFYVISPETSALTITYLIDTAHKEAMAELNKLASELRAKLGSDIKIVTTAKLANADFEIITYAEEMNVDLVVMGMKGHNKLKELLVGSTATNVISHCKFPILLVPENATFRYLKNVVLATDYKKIEDASSLNLLRELLELFGSNIRVASVITEGVIDDEDEKGISPEVYLDDFSQKVHFIENQNVIEGLNEFVDKSEADLVVTIPRMHSFLYYLISGSITRKMAFHTHVPLLTLPGSRHT